MKESEMLQKSCPFKQGNCQGSSCMACNKYEILSSKEKTVSYYCSLIYQEQVFEPTSGPLTFESPQIPEGYIIREIKND